jgi:hypothetical protein
MYIFYDEGKAYPSIDWELSKSFDGSTWLVGWLVRESTQEIESERCENIFNHSGKLRKEPQNTQKSRRALPLPSSP